MASPPELLLDLRDDDSPVALLQVCRGFGRLQPGQRLLVMLDSPQWAQDLPRIVERSGGTCRPRPAPPGQYHLEIRRRSGYNS